jgi:hypothetical protein
MNDVPRDELLARLVQMRDVCGLSPANGIRAAYEDGEIDLDTAKWLIDKMIDHELDKKVEATHARRN